LYTRLPYARGSIAIDFVNRKLYAAAMGYEVLEFDLPAGIENNLEWVPTNPVRSIPGWWPQWDGYCNGLAFINGKLYAALKPGYNTNPPQTSILYGMDGSQLTVPLPPQQFGGFVKSVNGVEYGCGGYESGQGWAYGPTLATMAGEVLINHDSTNTFEQREKREPNYHLSAAEGNWDWIARNPINGVGCWACDRIYGGGLRLPSGIYYWPHMGTGEINYHRQTPTFGESVANYQYRYDASNYNLIGWAEFPHGRVAGQDISPDGQYVYLCIGDAWQAGTEPHCAIYIFKVN
jgi:hypothetical protein